MPRPKPHGDINAERHIARRVRAERQERGWSNAGLARRLSDVGCPINETSLYKLQRGDPPRRVTVDELVAFSRVFGVSVNNMLVDPDIAEHENLLAALNEVERCRLEWVAAEDAWVNAHALLVVAANNFHGDVEALRSLLEEYTPPPGDAQGRSANRILMQSEGD